jgi:hypothetical protein
MAVQGYDILLAVAEGRRAIRRGDLAAAERWFKLAERACGIEVRLGALARADARAGLDRNPYR